MTRYEIRAIGFGGQGVISLSKMIIVAAAEIQGYLAVQTETYSAAARGGKCWADCVVELDKNISMIDYPRALSPYDFVFILSNEAASEIKSDDIKDKGWLLWDDSVVSNLEMEDHVNIISIPARKIALEDFGNIVFASTILFGAFTAISKLFPDTSARDAIASLVPKNTLDQNIAAFEKGLHLAKSKIQAKGGT